MSYLGKAGALPRTMDWGGHMRHTPRRPNSLICLTDQEIEKICRLYARRDGQYATTEGEIRSALNTERLAHEGQSGYLRWGLRAEWYAMQKLCEKTRYVPSKAIVEAVVLVHLLECQEADAKTMEKLSGMNASQRIYDAARETMERIELDTRWHPAQGF